MPSTSWKCRGVRWIDAPITARFLALTLLCASTGPAEAVDLSEKGQGVAVLRGRIGPGDDAEFRSFLQRERARPLKVLYLESHGGDIAAGVGIARAVRKAALTTVVDASGAYCDSACTLVFAGGVRRHYVGGGSIEDGFGGHTGLGYHQAHRTTGGGRFGTSEASGKGSDRMAALYREMGQPGAVELAAKAPFDVFWRISGATALNLRIATSLSSP